MHLDIFRWLMWYAQLLFTGRYLRFFTVMNDVTLEVFENFSCCQDADKLFAVLEEFQLIWRMEWSWHLWIAIFSLVWMMECCLEQFLLYDSGLACINVSRLNKIWLNNDIMKVASINQGKYGLRLHIIRLLF